MKKIFISFFIALLCLCTLSPVLAEGEQSSNSETAQTTATDSSESTRMKAELKYEVLAKITMKYDTGKITYDEIHVNETIKEPEVEPKEGYDFIGWYNEETGEKWDFSTPVKNHTTLVARYRKKAGNPADTGDRNNIVEYASLAAAAIGVILIMAAARRKNDGN